MGTAAPGRSRSSASSFEAAPKIGPLLFDRGDPLGLEGPRPLRGVETCACKYCRELIAGYKLPRSIEFRDALPTSRIGKVLKSELRNSYSVAHAESRGTSLQLHSGHRRPPGRRWAGTRLRFVSSFDIDQRNVRAECALRPI